MKNRRYLIIGNSISGVSCAEGIRKFDMDGEILIFSCEDIFNYSKPLITYYI